MTPKATAGSSRLGTYLTLALGAGALGTECAQAGIVDYHITPVTLANGDEVSFDLATGAVLPTDPPANSVEGWFQIWNKGNSYVYGYSFSRPGYSQNAFVGMTAPAGNVISRLAENDVIDASQNWNFSWDYFSRTGWTTADSPWATGADGTTGFMALKFSLTSAPTDFYYGWAKVTLNLGASQTMTLTDFAYETSPNTAILAGDTGAVPEPSVFGWLVAGACGVLAARRYRQSRQSA